MPFISTHDHNVSIYPLTPDPIGVGSLRLKSVFIERTFRPLLLDQPLEQEIERFAAHLAREHEQDLHFARRPYQGHVDDAEGLRREREPGAEVGYGIVRVLWDNLSAGVEGIIWEEVRGGRGVLT